ncbi:hypothetical protein QYF36_001585 [Acer negundo]|nr:hypothetical protein QYF36_001585 [Acer negundo]
MDNLSFIVEMEVDPKPVSQSWLAYFMGLKNTFINPAPRSTTKVFEKSGYASSDREVKGGSDVRGLLQKAIAFQNSKEVIGRMERQHANLASDKETSSFSSDSDIIELWKGECSSKNRAMWLGKFGPVDESLGLSLDFESPKAMVSNRDIDNGDMGNVVSPHAKMPKMDTGNVVLNKTMGLVVDQTFSFLKESHVGVILDDKTSSSPIENKDSMKDNSPEMLIPI